MARRLWTSKKNVIDWRRWREASQYGLPLHCWLTCGQWCCTNSLWFVENNLVNIFTQKNFLKINLKIFLFKLDSKISTSLHQKSFKIKPTVSPHADGSFCAISPYRTQSLTRLATAGSAICLSWDNLSRLWQTTTLCAPSTKWSRKTRWSWRSTSRRSTK